MKATRWPLAILFGLGMHFAAWAERPVLAIVHWPGVGLYERIDSTEPLVRLEPGAQVEFIERSHLWWKVRHGQQVGWANRLFLEKLPEAPPQPVKPPAQAATNPGSVEKPASAPVAAPVVQPSAQPNAATVSASAPVSAAPSSAFAHQGKALLIGVGQYSKADIPALLGVPLDLQNARRMAQFLGIESGQITELRDQAVTSTSLLTALADFEQALNPGQPAFVYFTGHGTRYVSPDSPALCQQALVGSDGVAVQADEFKRRLNQIANRSGRLFVFVDACFSGGVLGTRDVNNQLVPKLYTPDADLVCGQVANLVPAVAGTRSTAQWLSVTAAKDNEMSFDTPNQGGLATSNWMACLSDFADKGQTPALGDLQACAQQGINRMFTSNPVYKAHHIQVAGDPSVKPFGVAALPVSGSSSVAANSSGEIKDLASAFSFLLNQIESRRATEKSLPGPATLQSRSLGQALMDQSSAELKPQVIGQSTLRIGRDALQIQVTSPRDGYLYVWAEDARGSLTLLFPNRLDADNRVFARRTTVLPRPNWPLKSAGPVGQTRLWVSVWEQPRVLPPTPSKFLQLKASNAGGPMAVREWPVLRDYVLGILPPEVCSDALPMSCQIRQGTALFTLKEIQP